MKTELILILFAGIISISMTAFAQVDEVDVGFEWDDKECTEFTQVTDAGKSKLLVCSWNVLITGEEPPITKKPTDSSVTIEPETVDEEIGIDEIGCDPLVFLVCLIGYVYYFCHYIIL